MNTLYGKKVWIKHYLPLPEDLTIKESSPENRVYYETGIFVDWGIDYILHFTSCAHFTVAMIEDACGDISLHHPTKIRFQQPARAVSGDAIPQPAFDTCPMYVECPGDCTACPHAGNI